MGYTLQMVRKGRKYGANIGPSNIVEMESLLCLLKGDMSCRSIYQNKIKITSASVTAIINERLIFIIKIGNVVALSRQKLSDCQPGALALVEKLAIDTKSVLVFSEVFPECGDSDDDYVIAYAETFCEL